MYLHFKLLELVGTFFKACVPYFLTIFCFSPNDSPTKLWNSSRDFQIFVFPSSPLFLPVSHCFRAWSKINLKVYDVINCLNKNLITHFVQDLWRWKGIAFKLCPWIEYEIRNFFMEKWYRKCAPKASPRPFFW